MQIQTKSITDSESFDRFAGLLADLNNSFVKKAAGLLEGYFVCRIEELQTAINNVNHALELIRDVENQLEHLTYACLYPE